MKALRRGVHNDTESIAARLLYRGFGAQPLVCKHVSSTDRHR